jgi:hypothetical protein
VVVIEAVIRHTSAPTCSNTAPAIFVVVVAFGSPSMLPVPDGTIVRVFAVASTFLTATSAPTAGADGRVTVNPAVVVSACTKSPAAAV